MTPLRGSTHLFQAVWFLAMLSACSEAQTAPLPPLVPSGQIPTAPLPHPTGTPPTPDPKEVCDAGDQAFVRRATLGLLGRRPLGQGEVDALVDAIGQLRSEPGGTDTARRRVARLMMRDDAFRVRWSDFLKDALRIARTQGKSLASCYGEHESASKDGGALATFVRDNHASSVNPPRPNFTMQELLASALELDDLSVVYRAHLFAMMSAPFTGNALELELELARRNDFGVVFETAYTRRDITCLGCHNSEYSITTHPDPALNRFWPIPGRFERALFGSPSGAHPASEADEKGSDILRSRGMFRYHGLIGAAGIAPFGWAASACGEFAIPTADDPLQIDTWFGSIRSTPESPSFGLRASIWDLERALHRGVELVVAEGLPSAAEEVHPDKALASLVALNIVENVWTEVVGTPLTISHRFPRTSAQRDMLATLANRFVSARFSLKGLLLDIVEQEAFNLKPPSAGCGAGPYPLPRIFDPWTDSEPDPSMRGNGPSDGVFALSPRLLRRSLHSALGWPGYPEYPTAGSREEALALAFGFFLRDGEPGRREFDFQGRLAWEAAYGGCPKPPGDDFITELVRAAASEPSATLFDAVVALKDRLTGDPRIGDDERAPLEALLGSSTASRDLRALEGQLRRLCGALVSSPWFMLGGLVPDDAQGAPKLTPPEATHPALCRKLKADLDELVCPE